MIKTIKRAFFRLSDALQEALLVLWLGLPLGFLYRTRTTVPVIASLTTYPPRIDKSWQAIETLLRQSVAPERLILVLSLEEFPSLELPKRIRGQMKRGLEVLWVDRNGRSYDKMLPARSKFPRMTVVTFDDDKFFPRNLLRELFEASLQNPGSVVGARGWIIRKLEAEPELRFGDGWTRATQGIKGSHLFTPGGNGCLYPYNSLSHWVDDLDEALRVCPTSDDIWFWGALQKNKSSVVCLGMPPHRPVSRLKRGPSLSSINSTGEDTQFQTVLDYFNIRGHVLSSAQPGETDG